MNFHICTICRNKFPVTAKVRVCNSISYLINPFHGPMTQLKLFSYVRCPECGHEEFDPSIKFLWIFPPNSILWFLFGFLILAIIDAIFSS